MEIDCSLIKISFRNEETFTTKFFNERYSIQPTKVKNLLKSVFAKVKIKKVKGKIKEERISSIYYKEKEKSNAVSA